MDEVAIRRKVEHLVCAQFTPQVLLKLHPFLKAYREKLLYETELSKVVGLHVSIGEPVPFDIQNEQLYLINAITDLVKIAQAHGIPKN